jgi:hypothetical protein
VPRFDLADFLARTGLSLRKLATYLQVAPAYLEAALAEEARLTARDQAACRLLWRRLFRGKQLELPFAESPNTFTRTHACATARARAVARAPRRTTTRTPGTRTKPRRSPGRKTRSARG